MPPHSFIKTNSLFFLGGLLVAGTLLFNLGCQEKAPRRRFSTSGKRSNDASFLVNALAQSLNNLPSEVSLQLRAPFPVLDDSKSADGKPILAACDLIPGVQGSGYNYLYVPAGNGNFRTAGIQPGDIVRYFIDIDEDSVEHGIARFDYLKGPQGEDLIVRRLDVVNDPQNALILQAGLSGPVFPEAAARIEIWRYSDKRADEIRRRINRYASDNPKDLIDWEPTPEESALDLLVDRANQWLRNRETAETTWQLEPLIGSLPEKLRKAKPVIKAYGKSNLESGPFSSADTRQLQQAIWLRDISRWASGEAVSPLDVATALFDWTIRNIQLDAPDKLGIVHQPWQALMYGHGGAEQRAWIFAELCRQQQLDVVMLAVGEKWWLPALLYEGQLYLFDTRLGLPIPGKAENSVATLAEVVADPSLLRDLDILPEKSETDDLFVDKYEYPITAEDLKKVNVWLVASPLQLSRRAWLLQQAFQGDDFVVLAANTTSLKKELKTVEHLQDTLLWPWPAESILSELGMSKFQRFQARNRVEAFASRPRLWKARTLHFQGTKEIPLGKQNDPLARPNLGHQQATALYQHKDIRPSIRRLRTFSPTQRKIDARVKNDASYWIGLLSYDLGKYEVAQDWLAERTLKPMPKGPWLTGALYNLARTQEALRNFSGAISLLKADNTPQRHGNLLRAKQLETRMKADGTKDEL